MITMKLVCDERRCNNVRIRITNNRRKAELATDMYLPPLDLDLALSPNPPKRLERLANVLACWNKQLSRQAMCGAVSTALRKYAGRDDLTLYWARHTKQHSKRHT